MKGFRKYFVVLVGSLISLGSIAQPTLNSPFSILGIGDITGNQFTRNSAMGGLSIATRHPWYIDVSNPASYTVRDTLTMVFDFGLHTQYNLLENATISDNTLDINFNHFAFSFPVAKGVGMTFGVLPYSQTSYILNEDVEEGDADYDPNVGSISYQFQGEGGIHQFFIGSGIKLSNHFSVGVNARYLFGEIKKIHSVTFNDNVYALNTKLEDRIIVSDITFDLGLQYYMPWDETHSLTLGLVTGNNKDIRYSQEHMEYGVFLSATGSSYNDTVLSNYKYNNKMFLPYYLGAGATVNLGDKFRGGIEYLQQDWSNATLPFSQDTLTTSRVIRAGAEIIPNPRELRRFWKKIQYRAGVHYGNSYIMVNQKPVTDFGMSFGIGLPILGGNIQGIRKWSFFNITYGTGWRGSVENNTMKERYNFINFGLSFNDIWFVKRKYY